MAAVDIPGFIADLKDHAIDHHFHVHDERHFVETYSMRQSWEVVLHPEEACGGPLDLHLALEVDPRIVFAFEDQLSDLGDDFLDPEDVHRLPLYFNWALPPLPQPPDLLILATDLAGIGGTVLPMEVSAIDSFASVTDSPKRSLTIVGRVEVSLSEAFMGREQLCDPLDKAHEISLFLLEGSAAWLEEA